jgi:WD40 repeat protein
MQQYHTTGTTVSPIAKLSHGSGVASLAWLQEGQTLAVGCQQRYVQLYDLRMAGSSSLASSVWAHRESVNGVEMDPHRSNIFATFSRTAGEPVKLWDTRRMESSLTEIKLNTSQEADMTASPYAYAVKWSYLSPGMLSVAVGNTVQLYDTMTSSSRPVLSRLNYVMGGLDVQDMALHSMRHTPTHASTDGENGQSPETLLTELHQHRMLAVLSDRSVYDVPKFMNAPLMVSWRDGSLAHSLGRTIWMDPSPDSEYTRNIAGDGRAVLP